MGTAGWSGVNTSRYPNTSRDERCEGSTFVAAEGTNLRADYRKPSMVKRTTSSLQRTTTKIDASENLEVLFANCGFWGAPHNAHGSRAKKPSRCNHSNRDKRTVQSEPVEEPPLELRQKCTVVSACMYQQICEVKKRDIMVPRHKT